MSGWYGDRVMHAPRRLGTSWVADDCTVGACDLVEEGGDGTDWLGNGSMDVMYCVRLKRMREPRKRGEHGISGICFNKDWLADGPARHGWRLARVCCWLGAALYFSVPTIYYPAVLG